MGLQWEPNRHLEGEDGEITEGLDMCVKECAFLSVASL